MSLQNDIIVKFKNQPELYITLDDNDTAHSWLALFKTNYEREFPIFRDHKKYSLEYLNQLAVQAKNNLGWDCETDIKSIDDTIRLHKNLETTLANGFDSIPAEYDNLIHELHYCLHTAEWDELADKIARPWLQLEWFNNDGFTLDESFCRALEMDFGAVRLQNPYVGHPPPQIYIQNDYENIFQTCRFHNFVRPGLHIYTGNKLGLSLIDKDDYINWWLTNAPDFVATHGIEKILHYSSDPVIGHVSNLDDLRTVVNSNDILELEEVICLH